MQIRDGAMETTLMDVPLDKGRLVKEAKTGLKGLDDLAQNAGVTGISRPYDAPLNRSKLPARASIAGSCSTSPT